MTMEATAAYPQWPPVLVSAGLGGTIAATTPDHIPLQPVMVNDPRERLRVGGVDCVGIVRECHRNLEGLSYLRPFKRVQYKGTNAAEKFAIMEDKFFHRHNRDFVPRDVQIPHLYEALTRDSGSLVKWQGNALAGIALPNAPGDHAVFFPTGQILQQACVYRNVNGQRDQCVSNRVECGAVIRQFELLGSQDTYEMYGSSTINAIARGAANCTVLSASFGGDDAPMLSIAHKLKFEEMVSHVAGSPHTDSDAAFVTGDGKVHTWDRLSGVQEIDIKPAVVDERLSRCEYSSNPCVLWTANRVRAQTLDLRAPRSSHVSLFDLVKMNAPHSDIYALKRRATSPFQLIIGTSVSVELLDSRMPGKALLTWLQQDAQNDKLPYFGVLDEIPWSKTSGSESGLAISSTQGRKTMTLYPFARHSANQSTAGSSSFLSVAPLRSLEKPRAAATQYIALDSPLDLQLRDGAEWTTLSGVRALVDNAKTTSATVYQLNSYGDLFCQQIRPSIVESELYETAVQLELPCGVTAQTHPQDQENSDSARLPVPSDAILPEYENDSLTPFIALPVKPFVEHFPRLPPLAEEPIDGAFKLQTTRSAMDSLRHACRPSATLFRLQRFVNDELHIRISSQSLLQVLRASPHFNIRSVHHRARPRFANVLDPFANSSVCIASRRSESDPRLAHCNCCPQTSSEPCESLSCIVPHAILISSGSDIHTELCFPTAHKDLAAISDDMAAILEQAREVYGQDV